MITEGQRDFNIPDKPVFAAWPCPIDISRFLDGDTISNVGWSATKADGTDATADVFDAGKHTTTASEIVPWIERGEPGATYIALGKVTTSSGAKEVFSLRWTVLPFQAILKTTGMDAVLIS